jgi:hypothetical protein
MPQCHEIERMCDEAKYGQSMHGRQTHVVHTNLPFEGGLYNAFAGLPIVRSGHVHGCCPELGKSQSLHVACRSCKAIAGADAAFV